MKTGNKKPMITQSTILERGWTKSMISAFLPDPIERENPHYKRAAPMKLWELETVEAMEQTEAFKQKKEKADAHRDAHRASAKKAVQTKIAKLDDELTAFANSIKVEVIADRDLVSQTIDAKNEWFDRISQFRDDAFLCERSAYSAPDEVKTRWIVNYIRHNLTDYDEAFYSAKGKCGFSSLYGKYRNMVLDKIAAAYPKYADECERQKQCNI